MHTCGHVHKCSVSLGAVCFVVCLECMLCSFPQEYTSNEIIWLYIITSPVCRCSAREMERTAPLHEGRNFNYLMFAPESCPIFVKCTMDKMLCSNTCLMQWKKNNSKLITCWLFIASTVWWMAFWRWWMSGKRILIKVVTCFGRSLKQLAHAHLFIHTSRLLEKSHLFISCSIASSVLHLSSVLLALALLSCRQTSHWREWESGWCSNPALAHWHCDI